MTATAAANGSGILAIDAGGTYFKSAIISGQGTLIAGSFYQEPAGSGNKKDEVIMAYEKIIRHALGYALAHGVKIDGIGISTPGPFDYKRGICLMKHKFSCLYEVNVPEAIRAVLPEIASIPVRFRHDANSFLAGEMWCGAAQGFTRTGGVTLGTGIGVACCIDGEFLINELGSPAPEVSVWNKPYCKGIVEDYVSSRALVEKYRRRRPDYAIAGGARGVAGAAKQGDSDALKAYMELGADLGTILLSWCERFRPQAIIFGGQISNAFELFAPSLCQIFSQINAPPKLAASQLGAEAALYGVAALFRKNDIRKIFSRI
jgi:glucokinase